MALTDKELVHRCQTEESAFEELLRRYKKVIFAYARAATGSHQDAEEITQDVFVKVYRAAHRFNDKYSFTTWLYTIASNTCKNKLRSRRPRPASLDDEDSPLVAVSADAGPLDTYNQKLAVSEVRWAIDELPPKYREVLFLRYVQGLSYKKIAAALELSMGNVEARIFRGKERVRRLLAKKLDTAGVDGADK